MGKTDCTAGLLLSHKTIKQVFWSYHFFKLLHMFLFKYIDFTYFITAQVKKKKSFPISAAATPLAIPFSTPFPYCTLSKRAQKHKVRKLCILSISVILFTYIVYTLCYYNYGN